MVVTFAKWVGSAVATWLLGEVISIIFGPFVERPMAWIKRKARGFAFRFNLATSEEGEEAYAMA